MKDCTTCVFDIDLRHCAQGHYRDYGAFGPGKTGRWIPIQDCHAWKEKDECICSGIKIVGGDTRLDWILGVFDIVCKTCGKKKRTA